MPAGQRLLRPPRAAGGWVMSQAALLVQAAVRVGLWGIKRGEAAEAGIQGWGWGVKPGGSTARGQARLGQDGGRESRWFPAGPRPRSVPRQTGGS